MHRRIIASAYKLFKKVKTPFAKHMVVLSIPVLSFLGFAAMGSALFWLLSKISEKSNKEEMIHNEEMSYKEENKANFESVC